MIQVRLLKNKRRKVKVDSKLGGQWKKKEKVLCLVANGRKRRKFFARWPMEGKGKSSLLGGQWNEKEKVLCLVVNGRWRRRFFAWWPMEGEGKNSLLGGQWKVKEKVLCLVVNGRWKKNPFHLFPLSPQPILPKLSIFPLDLKVLLYRGYRPLFVHFLLFPWLINHDCVLWCHKSPPHSLPIQFC